MTIFLSVNQESVVYENAQSFSFDPKVNAYSVVPENGEGVSYPFENVQGFEVTGGATEAERG